MNIILLHADQLRADCLGCYGNNTVQTPNIDKLAEQGATFEMNFAPHPQCVPSRSAMITGRYPHENGAISNYTAVCPDEQTLPEQLRSAGYKTIAVGKLHIFDQKLNAGFEESLICGGQRSTETSPEVFNNDYIDWLKKNDYIDKFNEMIKGRANEQYVENYQARVIDIPEEAYWDSWVADRCVEYIDSSKENNQPFFIFCGFPNPHNPFEALKKYADMYDPDQIDIPKTFHSDLTLKPKHQRNYKREGRSGYNFENLDEKHLRNCIANYYAKITMVDDQVGKIMKALERNNIIEETIVVFTADHGELLGHHGMLQKSTDKYPILYDKLLHIPLIYFVPEAPKGVRINELTELIDVNPTLMSLVNESIPVYSQGFDQSEAIFGGDIINREYVFFESGAVKGIRSENWKLVYYSEQSYGELYDIKNDPCEINNLYGNPKFEKTRLTMINALLDKLISLEAPRHGESLRSTPYYKELYNMPFE